MARMISVGFRDDHCKPDYEPSHLYLCFVEILVAR